MLIHPNKKSVKRLRDVLNQLYGHLDSSAQQGGHANQDVSLLLLFFLDHVIKYYKNTYI
jgi:hypothetical protein